MPETQTETERDSLSDFRDWAYLPPEIVDLISVGVKYIVDYVRFRAVCSTWRSSSRPKPRHLPPQLPWLMLPYEAEAQTDNGGTRFFYDAWESKMRQIPIPETRGMTCCASCRGWLLLVSYKGREVSLLNPLTRCEIELPPFKTWFDPYYISFGQSKMMFSADLTHPNCLITVFLEEDWVISCRVGDQSWKRFYPSEELVDATRRSGQLFLLYKGKMVIIDSNKLKHKGVLKPKLTFVFDPEFAALSKRFVEGKSGVYVVGVHPDEKLVLYRYHERKMRLKKVTTNSSDSTAIFYGDNYPCLTLSRNDWDLLDGGSLYMEHKCVPDELKLEAIESGYDLHSAKMVDGNVIILYAEDQWPPCSEAAAAMWFQPSFF
ncbi:F-box protein skip23 [Rhynchospora pubera]|uniref:F-box protein skip23 n=1 Tax=Rhynchospora pubera TaxID=906938 RepID=A0AAV8EYK9_9POAL|nr:F-box protein skip23 [Rhynchospora pubera]